MFDFKALHKELLESMSPSERLRIQEREEKEKAYDSTSREITALFSTIKGRYTAPGGPLRLSRSREKRRYERYVSSEREDSVKMRIEGDVLRFIGGPTGNEAFSISQDFVDSLNAYHENGDDHFYLCAGCERYEGCSVSLEDVISYLKDYKPDLFQHPSNSMTM